MREKGAGHFAQRACQVYLITQFRLHNYYVTSYGIIDHLQFFIKTEFLVLNPLVQSQVKLCMTIVGRSWVDILENTIKRATT